MEIISREDAKEQGLSRYYTGFPCSRGHFSERRTGSTACYKCEENKKKGILEPRKIYGVGFNSLLRGKDGYKARDKNGVYREYDHWRRMLQRSYDEKWFAKHPTYEKCEVDYAWWDYQDFAHYYHNCEYKSSTTDLDKDLLVMGNKVYGPETCVFIPETINKAIVVRGRVSAFHSRDNIYESYCNGIYLGRSSDLLAFTEQWVEVKQNHIRKLTEHHKDTLDPRAYEALMNFKVGVIDEQGTVGRLS